MGTPMRPELSSKNEYWISKHRFYELKHFCLQYLYWKKKLSMLDGFSKPVTYRVQRTHISDPTAQCAEARYPYLRWMDMVERAAKDTDRVIGPYILRGVTEGISYDILRVRTDIPCCKDVYYKLYRRFFWLLSQIRE